MKKPFYKRWWFWLIVALFLVCSVFVYLRIGQGIADAVRGAQPAAVYVIDLEASSDDIYNTTISGLQEAFRFDQDDAISVYEELQRVGIVLVESIETKKPKRRDVLVFATIHSGGHKFNASVNTKRKTLYSVRVITATKVYNLFDSTQGGVISTVDDYLALVSDKPTEAAQSSTTMVMQFTETTTAATISVVTTTSSVATSATTAATTRTITTTNTTITTRTTNVSAPAASGRVTVDNIQAGRDLKNDFGSYVTRAALQAPQSQWVYVSASGAGLKYHLISSCSSMNGTIATTADEARASGFSVCQKKSCGG